MTTRIEEQSVFIEQSPFYEKKVELLDEAEQTARLRQRKKRRLFIFASLCFSLILFAVSFLLRSPAPTPPPNPEVVPTPTEAPRAIDTTSLKAQIRQARQFTETIILNESDFALPSLDIKIAID